MSLPIDHARLPKPGETFAQKYRLECILGSGGMGVVFGATHLLTHKRVAIKWLAVEPPTIAGTLADTSQRFIREARLAGEFHHPNVVQVYDVGESQGSFFMVMEWLEGESLAGRLERVQRLSFKETLDYLVPCMQAIQRAHDADIIHRDIKPANIFLCDPTIDRPALSKVLDFGISKRVSSNTDIGTFVTRTGMLIGTPQYLAPEQLRARPVDRRTDIYGFGVLLYETIAGVLPFTADNFGDLVVEISTGTPRSLRELVPDLPLGVERVVAKAMARDPNQRYDSLRGLVADLEAVDPSPLTAATQPQLRLPTSLSPITLEPTTVRSGQEPHRSRVLALLAAAAVSAGVTGLILRQSGPAPRAQVAAESIVRPRALPPPTAAEPNPDPIERDSIPSGRDTLPTAALPEPIPQPQLDAAVDSGRPVPLQNTEAAGADAEKAIVSAPRVTPKPQLEAKTVAAQRPALIPAAPVVPAQAQPAQPAEPEPAHEPQPAAAAAVSDPSTPNDSPSEPSPSENNAREHNPLHMNIQ